MLKAHKIHWNHWKQKNISAVRDYAKGYHSLSVAVETRCVEIHSSDASFGGTRIPQEPLYTCVQNARGFVVYRTTNFSRHRGPIFESLSEIALWL